MFGSSGGAVAGLALAAHHPDKVRTLIAHEPPVAELLPDAPQVRAAVDDIEDAYRAYGSGRGLGQVRLPRHARRAGDPTMASRPPPGRPRGRGGRDEDAAPTQPPAPSEKQQADDETFFLRMLKPFTRYQPEVDGPAVRRPRVVIAVGETSRGEMARRSADALAERLGRRRRSSPATTPGSWPTRPASPTAIREVLANGR